VVGWLEPDFSFFFPRNGGGRVPALNSAADSTLVNDSLRRQFLAVEQPQLLRKTS